MNAVKAGLTRALEAQRDAEEKLNAKAVKHTYVLTSHAQKERQKRKAIAEQEKLQNADQPLPAKVRKTDGTLVATTVANASIVQFLRSRTGHSSASVDQVRLATGIDLHANVRLFNALQNNPAVDVSDAAGGAAHLRFKSKFGIRNAASLRHVLDRAVIEGISCKAICEKDKIMDPKGNKSVTACSTYTGVEEDIKELLDSKHVIAIERSDNKDKILFAGRSTNQASADLRELWIAARLPRADDLERALIARNIRSKDVFEERRAKILAASQAQAAEREASKKRKVRAIRKMTNEHLRTE